MDDIDPPAPPTPPSQPAPPAKPLAKTVISCDEIVQMRTRLPRDSRDDNARRWFITPAAHFPDRPVSDTNPIVNPISAGNEVLPYIYGRCAFADVVEVINTAVNSDHRIYLLGWFLNLDFDLIDGKASSMRKLLTDADGRGVPIRIMLYRNLAQGYDNAPTVEWVNKNLKTGAAILDSHVTPPLGYGSQHQKILVVCGRLDEIGFVGGMDIHSDRNAKSLPLHDVHLRIRGPATQDLLRVFRERWTDHPDSKALDNKGGSSSFTSSHYAVTGNQRLVQIGRTYPNAAKHGMVDAQGKPAGYSFLPPNTGETTAWLMIKNAIRLSQKFIYLEDQYLVDFQGAAAELALKLQDKNFERLIILACDTALADMDQIILRRRQLYDVLAKADPKQTKWGMYQLKAASSPPETEWCGPYVHSKSWIFDDVYAIVGSANCQRRCYSHDSEVVAGVADDDQSTQSYQILFAHELRMGLWRKHLGLRQENLWDWRTAAKRWLSPPASALIVPYDPTEINSQDPAKNPAPDPMVDLKWDEVWDPTGF
ncbi:MAG: hypothetical protein JO352_21800 [Chloroflexi bacterium]|nr:hypothetical protein [Chloroflexota bacterium]